MREYMNPLKISSEVERNTLRTFLFSCFTGLRISDIHNIKMENIVKNTLIFVPIKTSSTTNKTLRIPLPEPAQTLIKDVSRLRLYGKIFHTEADQTMNKRLKTILAAMDINKKMSFHCGRHTFATVFLRNGGKLHILQKLLGHHSIKETMKYVHILPDDTEEQMKIFNQFI
jgi:integrase